MITKSNSSNLLPRDFTLKEMVCAVGHLIEINGGVVIEDLKQGQSGVSQGGFNYV